jgi:hypothetical protein
MRNDSTRIVGNNMLAPLSKDWYVCPFHPAYSFDRVMGAKIHFEFAYKTYWPVNERSEVSDHYVLDARSVPPRWLEGERLH